MAFQEIEREEFIQRLIDAGWSHEQAKAEWDHIQEDDESGYDGPLGAS